MLTLRESPHSRQAELSNVLTESHNLGLIHEGSVLIRGGLIQQVGPSRRILNLAEARDAEQFDASGCLVLPGFVDADADLLGETATQVILRKSVERLLRHGTTAVGATSASKRAAKLLRESNLPLTVQLRTSHPGSDEILYPLARRQQLDADGFAHQAQVIASGYHPGRNPACSLQAAASVAVREGQMPLEAALRAITICAARALGISHLAGSIEPGKYADILILEVPDYREIPYHFGVNLVRAVIRHGHVVYRLGEIEWHED